MVVIFGFQGSAPITYEQTIGQVTDKYWISILTAIAGSGDYDFAYQLRRFNNNELICLKSLRRINSNEQGNHSIISGVVINIAEQRKTKSERTINRHGQP